MGDPKYRAFFSYSRADDRVASWLHRALDSYRTPKSLVGTSGSLGSVPRSLHPIFRDRADLNAGGQLTPKIQDALNDSATLVVLCSPAAAKSEWVELEVTTFCQLGREDRIFPIIASGEPDSGDPATECFPPALRDRGILAADLRYARRAYGQVVGDGRDGARLKLIAGLLGVPLDSLLQRERRRQKILLARLSTAAVLFLALAVAASVGFVLAKRNGRVAAQQRDQAILALGSVITERAWRSADNQNWALALKYALAGMSVAPATVGQQRWVLASALQETSETLDLLAVEERAIAVAYAPDNRSVAFAGEDGIPRVWDLQSRNVKSLDAHGLTLLDIAYTPQGRLLSFGEDGAIRESDVESQSQSRPEFVEPDGFDFARVDREGARVIASGGFGVRLWERTTQRRVWTIDVYPLAADFSPDGKTVIAMDRKCVLYVLDAATGRTHSRRPLAPCGAEARRANLSPRLAFAAVAAESGEINIFDVRTGRWIRRLQTPQGVNQLRFSPNERQLIVVGRDGVARLFHLDVIDAPITFRGHLGAIYDVAFNSDGSSIVSVGEDRTVRVWRIGRLIHEGPARAFPRVAASPDKRVLAFVNDTSVLILDAITLKSLGGFSFGELEGRRARRVRAAAISSVHARFYVIDYYGVLREYDFLGSRIRETSLAPPDAPLAEASVSPDGTQAVVFYSDSLRLTRAGKQVEGVVRITPQEVTYSADGRRFAGGDFYSGVAVWDDQAREIFGRPQLASRGVIESAYHEAGRAVSHISLNHDGSILALGMSDGSVRLFDVTNRAPLSIVRFPDDAASGVVLDDDGTLVAIATPPLVRIAEVRTGRILATIPSAATAFAFVQNGTVLVTGGKLEWDANPGSSAKEGVRAWDISRLRESAEVLKGAICRYMLAAPTQDAFTPSEMAADALLREVWTDEGTSRLLCPREVKN